MYNLNDEGLHQAYLDLTQRKFEGNFEMAEQLKTFISDVKSSGSTKKGIENWIKEIMTKLNTRRIDELTYVMLFKTNVLRLEYDEEYAEMQFM